MTAERRVAKLEAALTPTQRVLAWVDEAHASGGLSEYVDSLLDQPADVFPANRLAREAAEAARAGRRGRTADVDTEVLRAVRGTHFRFQLVLRINVVAHDMIERETLVYAALIGQLAALASEGRKERLTDAQRRRLLETLRGFTASRVSQLAAAQDARSIAETRYLAGRAVLFPDDAARWPELLHKAQQLAVMAYRLAELDGVPPPTPDDEAPVDTEALVADLVEPARVETHEQLDEGYRAFTIATAWLRSKAASSAGVVVETATL
jgi:hypothetical protein